MRLGPNKGRLSEAVRDVYFVKAVVLILESNVPQHSTMKTLDDVLSATIRYIIELFKVGKMFCTLCPSHFPLMIENEAESPTPKERPATSPISMCRLTLREDLIAR
uniref:Uncharacterized protein n=1 Tax=Rhodosorus marinus TaxID=101924 RepID=A0A7S0G215_9RHOD|mmetsp:Transcript_17747/g.25591  ORF Transcript_17747/g.25591 Transcript_17747/m.25591 type:complete len:106 (+) Transcript_17747:301-618(+)